MKTYYLTLSCVFSTLIMSCAFDPEEPNNIRIENNYYAWFDGINPQYGAAINYSKDGQLYEEITSNCFEIYNANDTLIFIRRLPGSKDLTYYLINTAKDKHLIPISQSSFNKHKQTLKPVITPEMQ